MHLNSEEKVKIFEEYGKGKTDTGSPEAQLALFKASTPTAPSSPKKSSVSASKPRSFTYRFQPHRKAVTAYAATAFLLIIVNE